MNFLRTVFSEFIGLFVDDWLFALLLVGWVGLCATLRHDVPHKAAGPILLAGLGALTLIFVVRQARSIRSSK